MSNLSIRSHAQIVTYWQQKSREWLNAQQFVMHLGRGCTRTMALRLNERGLLYDDLKQIYVTGSRKPSMFAYFTHIHEKSCKLLIVQPIFDFFISK